LRLLRILEEEGLISKRERDGMLQQVTQAASQKRASEVLTAAHTVHNKIVQVLRKGKVPAEDKERTELEVLYEITRLMQSWEDREKLFDRLLDLIHVAIPYEHATLFLVRRETKELQIAARKGELIDLIGGIKFDFGFGFSSWVAKQQKPVLLNDLHRGRRPDGPEVGSFISVPLIVQGELVGVLNLAHERPKAFTDDHLRMSILVAGQTASAIQRLLMYEEMERLAITDDLTGLSNRRHFLQHLQAELDRARRYGQSFSLVLLDLDHFKAINDSHGHQLGDRVLADLGRLLSKGARASDHPARYGGEEFIILMPMTDKDHAWLAAERIRCMISEHTFPRRKKLTASLGIASYPDDGTTLQDVLKKADQAMYEAKRAGRNKAVAHSARVAA
jgi:diguanylate cyclase (GGDEF)-like protein